VLLDLIFGRRPEPPPAPAPAPELLPVGARLVPLRMVRHPRARRYLLRLLPDGTARVTIPRGGSAKEARSFAERQTSWLENQLQRLREKPNGQTEWRVGGQIFFRGEPVTIAGLAPGRIQLGLETIKTGEAVNLRPAIQKHLHRLAARELPARVVELARQHDVAVSRVSVRNQRTRWGSCSRHGVISLNWRLIQLPGFVSDYVILHELMHRRQLNHSAKFWREVELVCPNYQTAEGWLKQHSALL
jgi:predicted metal-dependent hydrolase